MFRIWKNFNIIKFGPNFEIISEIINIQYKIDDCTCESLDIIGSHNSEGFHILSWCQNKNITVYDEIPVDNNERNFAINNNIEYKNLIPSNVSNFPTNFENTPFSENSKLTDAKKDLDSTSLIINGCPEQSL